MADRAHLDESPFPVPEMECRECGKSWEDHHPVYCYPRHTAYLVAMIAVIGICCVIIAVLPLFVPRW